MVISGFLYQSIRSYLLIEERIKMREFLYAVTLVKRPYNFLEIFLEKYCFNLVTKTEALLRMVH